jgi:hypothetical protein
MPPRGHYERQRRPQAVTEDYADDYEHLRDFIIDELNPRDGDDGEVAILEEAITVAVRFIERQPCGCTPERIENEDACHRCTVLGRLGDVRQER